MKTSEIIELSSAEILERIDANQDSLTRMKMNHAISPLDNPMKIRETRRNIARLETILRQKQNEAK